MIETLRRDAAALLAEGKVKCVLGYRQAGNGRRVVAMVTDPAATSELVFDDRCTQNLATYLSKPEVRKLMPVAVVATPAVLRAMLVLAAESQLAGEQVVVLATDGSNYVGPGDLKQAAASGMGLLAPPMTAGPDARATNPQDAKVLQKIAELLAMTPADRAKFWAAESAKCTRCYACRANCPACYCKRCIVEKNQPQWVSTAAREHGNFAWQMIRAFHTAGRCVACGACEAACPQGIPLMLLNLYLLNEVAAEFGYRAGEDPEAKPLVGTFRPEDDEEFIR